MSRRLFLRALGLGVFVLGFSAFQACAAETGNGRFAFEARVGGFDGVTSPATFENEKGWTVNLTRADVTLGPVYLNVIPPLVDTTSSLFDVFVRPAFAHDDHLGGGRIVGEVLAQVHFDALSSELVPLPATGTITRENVRTAEVFFYPEPGTSPDTTEIETVAFDVAGTAEKAGELIRFRGSLLLDGAWLSTQAQGQKGVKPIRAIREVRGVRTSFRPKPGGVLEIRLDVRRLFRGAEFSNLENANQPTDPDGTKVLVQASTGTVTTDQVMKNIYQGLHQTDTYAVRWRDP